MASVTSNDIRLLRDSLRGVLGPAAAEVTPIVEPWRPRWKLLADLDVTGFCVPEDRGGLGWQVEAAAAAAQELGAALYGGPFAAITASAIALSGTDDPAVGRLLEQHLAGDIVVGYAMVDPGSGGSRLVDGAPDLDALVVDLGADGRRVYPDRSTFSVSDSSDGFDVTRACGQIEVDTGSGLPLSESRPVTEIFRLLLAADSLGSLDRMLARTVEYAGQRIAFGKPIGANQAVQHRLVDHTLRARGMSLLIDEAARHLATGSPDASRLVALAELNVSARAPVILNDLIQLTGGIGFTWEYGLHYFVRRAHRNARLAANPWSAERSIARIEGWAP